MLHPSMIDHQRLVLKSTDVRTLAISKSKYDIPQNQYSEKRAETGLLLGEKLESGSPPTQNCGDNTTLTNPFKTLNKRRRIEHLATSCVPMCPLLASLAFVNNKKYPWWVINFLFLTTVISY